MNAEKHNLNTTVLKAVQALDLFDRNVTELPITAIAEKMDMPLSTTHRLLATLVYAGLLSQNPDNGRYRLGIKCFQLGNNVMLTSHLREASISSITELSKRYGETVNLVISDGGIGLIAISQMKAPNSSFTVSMSDSSNEIQATACGKCLLAFMPPQELENKVASLRFTRFTENSIVTPRQLYEQLEIIRERGYATEYEEGERGRCCCGVPIFIGTRCVAALSISIPTVRLTMPEAELVSNLKRAAHAIEVSLLHLRDTAAI